MNSLALQHQILNCFALRASLTSSEVWSDIMSNTDQFWTKRHIQDELGELFRAGRISRRQRTKKAAFIYHVALENIEPKPEVFIADPVVRPDMEASTIFCESGMNDKYKPRPWKHWALIILAPLLFGLVSGLMWN